MKTIIQRQVWRHFTRYLIANEYASLQMEVYSTSQWFGSKAFIYSIWTEPEARNKGYANQLLQTAEHIAREQGLTTVSLECDSNNEQFVLDWYLKSGYQKLGCYRGEDILMRKNLK